MRVWDNMNMRKKGKEKKQHFTGKKRKANKKTDLIMEMREK